MDLGQGKHVLIVVPTYNEADNVVPLLSGIFAHVPQAHVLFVDDNSQDKTRELIRQSMAQYLGKVFLLERPGKAGLGKAYVAGFGWGMSREYKAMIEMDADLSHAPKYLLDMVALLEKYDVVVGSRYIAGGGTVNWTTMRKLISRCGSFYASLVLGKRVRDYTGGFNGWRRTALETIAIADVKSNGYVFQIDLKFRALKRGLSLIEFPIIFADRVAGISKMSGRIVYEAMWRVWALRFFGGK